jgi:hypothetical protein
VPERVQSELKGILTAVRQSERTIPLLASRYAAGEVEFRPLPPELLEIISASPDYVEIVPGEGPTWIKFIVDGAMFELVVYRTLADDRFYILGPVATLQ